MSYFEIFVICINIIYIYIDQIPDDIDMMTFKLKFYNISYNYIHICLLYRRPNYNKQLFYDFIYKHFSNFNFSNLIFCGDFNINLLDKLDSHAFF